MEEKAKFKSGYSEEDVCLHNIMVARSVFSSKSTTREEYLGMINVLGLMFFRGPHELNSVILATIMEAQRRQVYYDLHIWH